MRRTYVLTRDADRREQPAFERARRSIPFDVVARCVGRYRVEPESFLRLRDSDRRARDLLVYGVCRFSRAGESLTSLAGRFGIPLSGLTMARNRVEEKLGRDKELREAWSQIEQRLKALR